MLYLLLAVIIAVTDQLVKNWAVLNLRGRGTVEFVPGILNFYYAENTGAAFSILRNQRWLFISVSIIAVIVIIYIILFKKIRSVWGLLPLSMVLGGAVGNLIDRIANGYVVDMFEFAFVRFAIFNVADIFVTVGGILFCIYYLYAETVKLKKSEAFAAAENSQDEDSSGEVAGQPYTEGEENK
ncbi:MAG: signal peptidase II [Eubacteriales bacterium]|jgi:signal peptidase II